MPKQHQWNQGVAQRLMSGVAKLIIGGIWYFQELIGLLQWACKLGYTEIATKVLLLASHPALAYYHGKDTYNSMYNLHLAIAQKKRTPHGVWSPSSWHWQRLIHRVQLTQFLPRIQGTNSLGDAPEPHGIVVTTHCFVDVQIMWATLLVSCVVLSQESNFLLTWCLVFGTASTRTQLTLLHLAADLSPCVYIVVQYKLQMFGIPIDCCPTIVCCHNEAVANNAFHPKSTLKKKHINPYLIVQERQWWKEVFKLPRRKKERLTLPMFWQSSCYFRLPKIFMWSVYVLIG